MENLNKFKILTIVLVCMFVFVVAAIYSNTKDATTNRMLTQTEKENAQNQTTNSAETTTVSGNVDDLAAQIDFLNKRIDELSEKLNNPSGSAIGLNCKLVGTMTENGIEELTEEAAIQEAKINNREMVITCSFQ